MLVVVHESFVTMLGAVNKCTEKMHKAYASWEKWVREAAEDKGERE